LSLEHDAARRFPACIMATVVVPWTQDHALDERTFRREIATLLDAGYSHLYIFGTAGEGYAVDDAHFEQVSRVFVDEIRGGGAEPMIGVISLSLEAILRRIALARDSLGVRQFQVSLPSWGALQEIEVRAFFDAVLGRFDTCEFLHYNLLRSKRLVTAAEYAQIAADHANLVATKNSTDSMQRIRDLLKIAPTLRHFLSERGFAYGSLIDECGLLISLATTNLRMGRRYFEAGHAGDGDTLLQLEGELAEISREFSRCVGGGKTYIDGAYDKALWRLHDPEFPLRLLPPYEGADAEAVERFRGFLCERYPHWAP
jgi:dihydrodipicolinate synthase/N-acetylneuraminate lyase